MGKGLLPGDPYLPRRAPDEPRRRSAHFAAKFSCGGKARGKENDRQHTNQSLHVYPLFTILRQSKAQVNNAQKCTSNQRNAQQTSKLSKKTLDTVESV
jgi:hypothetical protein